MAIEAFSKDLPLGSEALWQRNRRSTLRTAPDRFGRRPAVDAPWQPFTAQLIQRAKATVVPFHFAGQNGRLFQVASHVSLTLGLSLILREVEKSNRDGPASGDRRTYSVRGAHDHSR